VPCAPIAYTAPLELQSHFAVGIWVLAVMCMAVGSHTCLTSKTLVRAERASLLTVLYGGAVLCSAVTPSFGQGPVPSSTHSTGLHHHVLCYLLFLDGDEIALPYTTYCLFKLHVPQLQFTLLTLCTMTTLY
jgi:hypothetical protein